MKFQHECHDHPLILNEYEVDSKKQVIFCNGCKEEAIGSTYSCLQCNFHLHKSCAELPTETESILHPMHSLDLLLCPPEQDPTERCNCCSQSLNGFSYGCYVCRFYVHPRCAFVDWETSSLWTRRGELEFHRIHEHPLVPKDESEQEVDNGKRLDCCVICQQLISSGPTYSCPECRYMRIHQSCAELPPAIANPFLRSCRPLLLFAMPWIGLHSDICTACKLEIKGFFYSCPESDLFLHIECSSPLTNDEDNHRHEFLKLQTFINFTCRACGEKDEAFPWICAICHTLVHRKCSLLPQILKVFNHDHSLYLRYTYLLMVEADKSLFCKLCYHKVDTTYATYRCLKCNYIAHLQCALEERDETNVGYALGTEEDDQVPSEAFDSMENFQSQDNLEEETNVDLKHYSHPHNLTLRTEELEDDKYCEGCLQLIADPFYCCVECDFFLHERCATLPRKIRHPLHPEHNLSLAHVLSEDQECSCKACKRPCFRGFFYGCGKCSVTLDIRCSSFLAEITHPGHKHPLMFAQTRIFDECSACGFIHSFKGKMFVCTECNFRLDFGCATLALKAKHKYDSHRLNLTYVAEDDSGEYYCDICEEERNPNHWYYHCAICVFSAHPKCVLKNYTYINFGVYDGHPHPLKFVVDYYDRIDVKAYCHACNMRYDNIYILECIRPRCNFSIHGKGGCFEAQKERKVLRLRNQ